MTRAVVTQGRPPLAIHLSTQPKPSPGTVRAVVLGLAVLSLLHFRVLRHSVFRTPSRCVLVLCSCVAASVVFLRFLVSTDPALRSSACHAAQSTTPLEFSCTDDSLSETMSHLRAVLPLPTWRDVVALAPKHGMMAWMVRAIDVLEPGAKYVGLCLGAALLVLPEALQRAIHTLLRRAFRHPAGKAALALAVSSIALVVWLAHARGGGGDDDNGLTAELLGYWALSSLVGFLFVQAVWPHLFRVAFFALAPAYMVGGAILFYKALVVFLHESCGAALPVSLGLTLVLFYAHGWDCTKAFGAYVLWKSLACFTVPFYSLPTFFSFVYWWTSSLTTTIFSALTHLASSTTSSSSSATSSSSSSSFTSTHLSMPWTTLDALFLLYFVGVALTAVLNSLAALALLAAQRQLAYSSTTQHHHHDAPPPVDLDHHHPKRD
ncbi:uncharacterized protein ACA1_306900 [Acanthamoeba castellanii str. Neff]|uniref:Transmembrane protein n=1 Tax=Acanthamoeba castellanii (strain ATCC 30010 / Neff) TaxID=1257118 RepID=L8GNY3_ACACF|nr:uncharacterized protein ACA1_306900 [Acanthamoeba castellanii str. Neff]ELR14894.1 hypothetical protein ACA1_306900 [Acanthamoeba castellanii str. Neff]